MNRNQLRYFVSAAEHRSFTKAAEQYYISQTAGTQQIQQLEQTLGCELFDRSTRPVSQTSAGKSFLLDAKALQERMRRAQERGCRSAAFTFDRSPREFVTGKPVPLLTTPSERAIIFRSQFGVQDVFVEPFDQSMMTMPWEDFISELLVKKYHAVHLVAGHDFRFGHKNEGDVEKLRSYCAAHGLGCDIIPRVEKDGVTVSSTYIRSLLEAGEVRRAAEFLGHYFSVEGTVRHGEGIGKKALFPTANLIPEEHIIALKRGVYATRAHLPTGEPREGVTHVGERPTVSAKNTVTIETYLVGFDGDLYGQKLQLDFFDYLREEKKFSSTQELHDMIAQNAREAEMIVK